MIACALGAACEKPGSAEAPKPAAVAPVVPAPPVTPPVATVEPGTIRTEVAEAMLLHLDGGASVQRGGTGEFVALKIGDAIRQGDVVRTEQGGSVELGIGGKTVALNEGSTMTMSILGAKRVRAEIVGNAVASSSGEGDVELAALGTDAVASSNGGKVALIADGHGKVVATAVQGSARFTAAGKKESLGEGQVSAASKSAPPTRPIAIPRRIKLTVAWPSGDATNRTTLALAGTASATARVWVQGQAVETAADGKFSSKVALKRGRQAVTVVAVDALGRRAAQTHQLLMDPDAPSIQGEVRYR